MLFFLRTFISERINYCLILKKMIIENVEIFELKEKRRIIRTIVNFK